MLGPAPAPRSEGASSRLVPLDSCALKSSLSSRPGTRANQGPRPSFCVKFSRLSLQESRAARGYLIGGASFGAGEPGSWGYRARPGEMALNMNSTSALTSVESQASQMAALKPSSVGFRKAFQAGVPLVHQSVTLKFDRSSAASAVASRRVVAMAGGSGKLPSLNELPINSYINQQGRIVPAVEPGTVASVFAVLDKNKKVQYIGFSKDLRNTLRTLIGRRPEFCYFYKMYNLTELDQQKMLDIRGQWFSEIGIPPVGNTDPIQRAMWEKPADAGSISERGKVAAAQSKAKTLLQMMVDRGLKEEMVYNPELLDQGLCDVLPSKEMSKEELAAAAAAAEASASRQIAVKETAPSGEVIEFDLVIDDKIKTNGGWMYDIYVTKDDKETRHRVVLGKIYPDAVNQDEDSFLVRTLAFLLWKKLPRQTEGILTSEQFGINYFSISEVTQKFPEFANWFQKELPDAYWRFNRIHSYGNETAPVQSALSPEIYTPQY